MKIQIEPFTKGGTKTLATPAEEIEIYRGNHEKIVQIRLGL